MRLQEREKEMSTDLTAMTAAELVAELTKHRNAKDLGIRLAMIGIRAELDARCETFEISLFERAGMVQFKYGQFLQKEGVGAWLNISAIDQHALEGYLLTKGGGK